MKLKYEFLLITSFGFIYFKKKSSKYIKHFIKISKKITHQAFIRKNINKKIKSNILIKKPVMLLLCFYTMISILKII